VARQHPIRRAAIFGASGGIGAALAAALLAEESELTTLYGGARAPQPFSDARVQPFAFDLMDEASIAAAATAMAADGPLDLVFVATGVLHDGSGAGPEKSARSLATEQMAGVMAINAIGPALIAKHLLPLLPRKERGVFAALSARVGSISDNRLGGWHSYRASKAALNMLIRNFAIETATRAPEAVIVGLHPGTVDSELSRPFQRGVAPDKLFSPAQSAGYLLEVIDGLSAGDSGGLFAWDGERIPY
jgi:NAD(P)-dependent dehydrogenase (short-subunit alcohol dehydrogenase family)